MGVGRGGVIKVGGGPAPASAHRDDAGGSGVVRTLDWHEIVSSMLDHLDRPAFVVDARGVLRAGNHAFAALAGCTVDELESSDFQTVFRNEAAILDRAEEGTLELLSGPRFDVAQRMAARVSRIGSGATRAYIVHVERAEPLERLGEGPIARRRYTVSAAHHTRGTLLEVEGSPHGTTPVAGSTCFRVMANRSAPCPGCPVFGDLGELPARAVVAPDAHQPAYRVVEVERSTDNRLLVDSLTLRENVLGELVEAKIQWIARESELTPRECEILGLLYLGRSTRDVADLLGISERTAKYHQSNVLRKVGADSRVDLVRLLL